MCSGIPRGIAAVWLEPARLQRESYTRHGYFCNTVSFEGRAGMRDDAYAV